MAWIPAKGTLSRRTFLTIIGTATLAVIILAITFIGLLENNEEALSEQRLNDELSFFVSQLDTPEQSRRLTAQYFDIYYQAGAQSAMPLPPPFQQLSSPFDPENDETTIDGREIQYVVKALPTGTVYAIQDITAMEEAEHLSLLSFAIASLLILLLSLVLGMLSSRYLTRPLTQLTHAINNSKPRHTLSLIDTDYSEAELQQIATAFNGFLDETQQHLKRERDLVNMASHELRTPIAIAHGALEIIEMRDNLNAKDKATLQRAWQALEEMQQNTTTLLKLSRGQSNDEPMEWESLNKVVQQVIEKLALPASDTARVTVQADADYRIHTNLNMLNMLLNNLLRNALQHSTGQVTIRLSALQIEVLSDTAFQLSASQGNGLGLFIVNMICERLGWELCQPQDYQGVRLLIPQSVAPTGAASQ